MSAAARSRPALLLGNFAIGCGVMVVPGTLAELARDLAVPVALAGQLITLGAATLCVGAPLFAAWVAGHDRRRLLTLSLVVYALGHAACALAPGFAWLLPLRAIGLVGAAVFTPQAAAAMGVMAAPAERGRAITGIFVGWSLASVVGMPVAHAVADAWGWRQAFGLVALLSALAALAVWRRVPDGVRPAGMSLASWRQALASPVLMAIVGVTALAAAGQFTVFAYIAPLLLQAHAASAAQVTWVFLWFGAWGLVGNLWLSRQVDRIGASRAVTLMMALMAASMLALGLVHGVALAALVMTPWAAGVFATNSAQQARLAQAAPAWAPALIALNTSAIYLGQSIGAANGGLLIQTRGYAALPFVGLIGLAAATALSAWAWRRLAGRPVVGAA